MTPEKLIAAAQWYESQGLLHVADRLRSRAREIAGKR
jgi:hypothetical protein